MPPTTFGIITTERDGVPLNRDLDFTKACHLSLAWDWRVDRDCRLRVEPEREANIVPNISYRIEF